MLLRRQMKLCWLHAYCHNLTLNKAVCLAKPHKIDFQNMIQVQIEINASRPKLPNKA